MTMKKSRFWQQVDENPEAQIGIFDVWNQSRTTNAGRKTDDLSGFTGRRHAEPMLDNKLIMPFADFWIMRFN